MATKFNITADEKIFTSNQCTLKITRNGAYITLSLTDHSDNSTLFFSVKGMVAQELRNAINTIVDKMNLPEFNLEHL